MECRAILGVEKDPKRAGMPIKQGSRTWQYQQVGEKRCCLQVGRVQKLFFRAGCPQQVKTLVPFWQPFGCTHGSKGNMTVNVYVCVCARVCVCGSWLLLLFQCARSHRFGDGRCGRHILVFLVYARPNVRLGVGSRMSYAQQEHLVIIIQLGARWMEA